ncbi:MAG: hypothetical protein IT542_10075, partial [Rubellimicrobium sp.]|nr:hypothetical protein [Rubellimicrobium sp.]
LHGPQVANAALAWEALDAAGAARLTRRESLGATVAGLLADPAAARAMATAAGAIGLAGQRVIGDTVAALLPLLPPPE